MFLVASHPRESWSSVILEMFWSYCWSGSSVILSLLSSTYPRSDCRGNIQQDKQTSISPVPLVISTKPDTLLFRSYIFYNSVVTRDTKPFRKSPTCSSGKKLFCKISSFFVVVADNRLESTLVLITGCLRVTLCTEPVRVSSPKPWCKHSQEEGKIWILRNWRKPCDISISSKMFVL